MASSLKLLFCPLLLLTIITSPGNGQPCGLQSIQISQRRTGVSQGLDFEFEVEIKNVCSCSQKNVKVHAPGFASQRAVDPKLLRQDGGGALFLVFGGNPIAAGTAVKFRYWWDHATYFSPAGSLPAC